MSNFENMEELNDSANIMLMAAKALDEALQKPIISLNVIFIRCQVAS